MSKFAIKGLVVSLTYTSDNTTDEAWCWLKCVPSREEGEGREKGREGRKGGREEGREGRKGGREEGRKEREGGRRGREEGEGGRKGGREEGRKEEN